ncbi:MAG: response regulator transcription factor [Gammaproteobacteria bacterium]|nr:response regulator transcription factor [Gammaproteobacteria bacterium]
MASVLLIDDDEQLGEALGMYLSQFNYDLTCVTKPSAAFRNLEQRLPDIILLDIMLPEQSGFAVCQALRRSHNSINIPVIMLTARSDINDRIVGLEIGADDYLAKPFEPRELLARMNCMLRRRQPPAPPQTPANGHGIVIDSKRREAWLGKKLLELSCMEYELLLLFLNYVGKCWTRDELLSELRGTDAQLYTRSVDILVSRLRKKLGDLHKEPRFIKTVWRKGYIFLHS